MMFTRRNYLILVVGAVVATEICLFALVHLLGLKADITVGIAAYTAAPLLVITLIELARNLRLQRAAFIKDYVSRFFTDKDLYQSFHDLIYTYPTSIFKKLEKIRTDENLDKEERPVFRPFEALQGERQVGARFYHPRLFQGSPEERRLDALLGFFDVIAYYYAKGFLRIEDIVGSVGYFLAVIHERGVISDYMKVNEEEWQNPSYQQMGVTPPFSYLKLLLRDIEQYNLQYRDAIKKLQNRRI